MPRARSTLPVPVPVPARRSGSLGRNAGPRAAGLAGRLLRLLCPVLLLLGISACRDATSDPLAVILTEESRSTLVLGPDLPALPDLAARAGIDGELATAVDLWRGSWEAEDEEGQRLRARAYETGSGSLAQALGATTARTVMADVGRALDAAGTVEGELETGLSVRVARARALHEGAVEALAAGDLPRVYARALAASDALRSVSPGTVARALVARAHGELEAAEELDPLARERAERLVHGARVALEEEDWARAVRRAYYACQVLGVSPR